MRNTQPQIIGYEKTCQDHKLQALPEHFFFCSCLGSGFCILDFKQRLKLGLALPFPQLRLLVPLFLLLLKLLQCICQSRRAE